MLKEILEFKYTHTDVIVPYLIFFVTSRCNFRCPNCFNLANLDDGKDDLSLIEIEKMAPTLGRLLWLALSGGEPFLRRDLKDLVEILYEHTQFKRFNIPTNGYATEAILKSAEAMLPLVSCDFGVTVSLDGVGSANDDLKGVKGSFDAATRTLDGLKELQKRYKHLSVKVNTVISNMNMNNVQEIGTFVRERFSPDFHAFELVRSQPSGSAIQPPTIKESEAVYKTVRGIWEKYEQYESNKSSITNFLAKGLYKYLHSVHLESMGTEAQAIPCLAGQVSAVIYEDGRTALCEMLPPIGELRNHDMDFRKVWSSETATRQRRMIKAGGCHCTHTCFQFTSVLFNPALYPKILLNACRK